MSDIIVKTAKELGITASVGVRISDALKNAGYEVKPSVKPQNKTEVKKTYRVAETKKSVSDVEDE